MARSGNIHVPDRALPVIRRFNAPKAPQPWVELFPYAPPQALHLLNGLLQLDPSQRLTADQALAHPYFDSLARVAPALPPSSAQGGRPAFSAPFEAVYPEEAPVYVLQAMLRAEIAALHAGITTPVQFADEPPVQGPAETTAGTAADDDEGMA